MTVAELLERYDEAHAAFIDAYWREVDYTDRSSGGMGGFSDEDAHDKNPPDVFAFTKRREDAYDALKQHFAGQHAKLVALATYTNADSKVTDRRVARHQLLS